MDALEAMMGKLVAKEHKVNRTFKSQVYQGKQGGQSRNFHNSYKLDTGNYQNKYRSNSRDWRIQFNRQGRGRPGYKLNYRRRHFRSITKSFQNFRRQNSRGNTKVRIGMIIIVEIEIGVNPEKGHFQEAIAILERMIEVQVIDQGQDQEQTQIEIELGVISVGKMIILQKIVLHPKRRNRTNSTNI